MLTELSAISPIDGRYRNTVSGLQEYFSEFALIRNRVYIEVEYLIALGSLGLPQVPPFSDKEAKTLRNIYIAFCSADAERIKEIEGRTRHDVKAVEYFLREIFKGLGFGNLREFIHFGLTSQDINDTAIPVMVRGALEIEVIPVVEMLLAKLQEASRDWQQLIMLARTHGQPASPTSMGKEISVYTDRITIELRALKDFKLTAKFSGATGNFNAHYAAYPGIDWPRFADDFIKGIFDLDRTRNTTQINSYDNLAALFDIFRRLNNIFIDFCQDMWLYIMLGYFKLDVIQDEVGSSAMPHKVNPIDFENAEGNLGIANAIFIYLSNKLPISRLQRDLTDYTVKRNIGVPIAHSLLSYRNIIRGFGKLSPDLSKISSDLEENWIVISEAVQTVLRREGIESSYDEIKRLTRGKNQGIGEFQEQLSQLNLEEHVKKEILAITPQNYAGTIMKKRG